MGREKSVLQKENRSHTDAEFVFRYLMGFQDCECEKQRAGLEIPPGRRFCVLLVTPIENQSFRVIHDICKGFTADGVNAPLLFCRFMGDCVVAVLESCSEERLRGIMKRLSANAKTELFGIYEDGLCGYSLYNSYERFHKQLERIFYFNGSNSLMRADFQKGREIGKFEVAFEAVLEGDAKGAEKYFGSLFQLIECIEPDVEEVREYLLSMYADMLVQNVGHNDIGMIKGVARIASAKYLYQIKNIVMNVAKTLAELNVPGEGEEYSPLVRETIHIVNENISNEDLSLRWIAGNILYTNVDYLGKIFKKETGSNFSHYVMEKRMEEAKKFVLDGESYKIYEVAERVGFGSNSQYFSQVFKKHTGVSPLEYREYAKALKGVDSKSAK